MSERWRSIAFLGALIASTTVMAAEAITFPDRRYWQGSSQKTTNVLSATDLCHCARLWGLSETGGAVTNS